MATDDRIRLLESGDVLEIINPIEEQRPARPAPRPLARKFETAAAPCEGPRETAVNPQRPARSTMHYATLLPLTYVAGPLALLLTSSGRRQRGWAALGVAAAAAILTIARVSFKEMSVAVGSAGPLLWSILAILATLGGFGAWARAVELAGRESVPSRPQLPRVLRRLPVVAALGMIAPGCGLLLAGRRSRAALAVWALWPAALGVLILKNAPGIWSGVPQSIHSRHTGSVLEVIFVVAAVMVLSGALFWLIQALEGMRQAQQGQAKARSDWYAVALGASCAVLALTANPERVAIALGEHAAKLREENLQVIPLQLNLAAHRLDSGQTDYVVEAMDLYAALGRQDESNRLRKQLDDDLQTYLALSRSVLSESASLAAAGLLAIESSPPASIADRPSPVDSEPAAPDDSANSVYYGLISAPDRPETDEREVPPEKSN